VRRRAASRDVRATGIRVSGFRSCSRAARLALRLSLKPCAFLPRTHSVNSPSLAWFPFLRIFVALTILAVAATASAQPPPPTAVPGEALFVVSGRGWGHGVGMSQYGALGQATEGRTYDEILSHYYSGTELGRSGKKEVRVLLAEGRRAVTISSTVPFTILDGAGTTYRVPKGPLTLRSDLAVPRAEGQTAATSPLLVRPGKAAPLSLDGSPYRGKLEIAAQGAFLRVVNLVSLEAYVQGVVAGEMPFGWPLEALKAQAVAARSYALANLVKGKPFDLYSDVRSQVYRGVAGETARTSEAVNATTGQVVLYGGRVASTLYFSSSGGKTASAIDVFGAQAPYLLSRPDPWDKASPYHRWGPVLIGARTAQSKLGIETRVLDAAGVATPSGRMRSLVLQTMTGSTTVPSALLRTALGLRSTWVTIGVLRLDRPPAPVVFGSTHRLTGIARGLPSPMLSASLDGGIWARVGELQRDANGLAAFVVKPSRSTRYRIEVKDASSPTLLVQVAPRVRLLQPAEPGVLTGTVRPRLPGALVSIERKDGSAWTLAAESIVDDAGAFRAQFAIVPGSYRARVAASDGFAAGVAPVLTVS
jgi:stage II sporulation protein D